MRANPVRRINSLIETAANEVLPPQLGPALHVEHVLPLAIDLDDQARLTTTPDASATAQEGSNLNRRRGVSFPTGADTADGVQAGLSAAACGSRIGNEPYT